MSDKQFTLYWLDGKRQVISGETIEQAYTTAGYGAGANKAVDFYMDGDNHDYVWNKDNRAWDLKRSLAITALMGARTDAKYKLFVSHNLGATYTCEYFTDDKDDAELLRRIKKAQEDVLRYYIEGDDAVMCPQHEAIVDFLGGAHQQRSIEEQAALLRNKFCR